jgi:transposase
VNAPDVVQQRNEWTKSLPELDKNKLVFLDESGVNTNLTRIYGRSLGGTRCVDNAPLSTPKNTTILSSIRLNGEYAYTTYQGGTTNENFIDYLTNVLAPTLHEGDIVVMDNMRTHRSKSVKKVIDDLNLNVIYLPPYSPDFNPIEKMWSKIKSILRKLKIRALSELKSGIQTAFSKVTADDCKGWFSSCFIG